MRLFAPLRSLASTLFHRSQVDREMEEELRSHIQHRSDDLERSGLAREEAERRARIEFGGQEKFKEQIRDGAGAHFFETLVQDLRFALRLLRKSPGFAAVAIFTLALGIGANTAIFSLIDVVMLRLLPVQKPEELMQLFRVNPARGSQRVPSFTNALWEQVRDQQNLFTGVFSWDRQQFDLAQGGAVEYVNGLFVSGGYFNTLGVRPAAGRLFNDADDERDCPELAVVSYGFWQEHFGGAASTIGATLSLNRHPFRVIGVSAPGFHGMEVGSNFDVAIPVCTAGVFDGKVSRLDERSWWWLYIAGRLKPGISQEQLKARLAVLSPPVFAGALPPDWGEEGSRNFLRRQLASAPAATGISNLRTEFGQPLAILMIIVGLILLIASANLASLMLARAASRNKEIAVRKALGASRARLIRQLLTEYLLLSFAGALAGMFFARWGTALLVRYISTTQSRVYLDLSPDVRVFVFTACIAVLTGILFGVLPALRATRISLGAAMKGGLTEDSGEQARLHIRPAKWIVSSQIALSLVLVVVAGLFLRSLIKLATLDLGFDRSNVLIVKADLKDASIPAQQHVAVYDDIQDRLRSLPGVVSVGRSLRIPITENEWMQPVVVDTPNPPKGDDANVYFDLVSPGYFQTLRTPLLKGRDFNQSDTRTSPSVAIVNDVFARTFLPGQDPVGQYFRMEAGKSLAPIQIVGLAKDSKYESIREDTFAQAFFPASQGPAEMDAPYFELRTTRRPGALISLVQSTVGEVNKGISLDSHSLAEQVGDSLVQERLLATLSAFFGVLALLLAMVGLYGTLSYLVTQRRSELGIRMALGATPASILALVMREVATIILTGAGVGIALSAAGAGILQKLLFGLSTRDTPTIIGAVVILSVVAIVAGYLPARRAMRVDPMAALRYE